LFYFGFAQQLCNNMAWAMKSAENYQYHN